MFYDLYICHEVDAENFLLHISWGCSLKLLDPEKKAQEKTPGI